MQQQCVSKIKKKNSRNETKELNELDTANSVGIYDYVDESNVVNLNLEVNQTGNNKEPNKYSNESSGDVNHDQEHDNESSLTLSDGYLKARTSAESSNEKKRHRETGIEVGAAFSQYYNTDDRIVPMNSDVLVTFKGKIKNENKSKYISMHDSYACAADVHRSFCENAAVITTTNAEINTNVSTDVST
ncbi:unnamed protein product [Mytilus coruscus]|uniref:Uncharacterized protein n=1 Tax=Mytilus coruscus TaxID=42192 RepID=A0A6J8E7R5_MYTCO|nr:unnamed protein product [Mytilus coruscus]